MNHIIRIVYLVLLSLMVSAELYATDYYWVNGTGNWSDFSSHWATTSGGNVYHVQVPQSIDHVIFDANSFSGPGQVVTIDQTIVNCGNMDWTNVQNNPTLLGTGVNTLKIFGSLTFVSGMTLNFRGPVSFEAGTSGQTIKMAGKKFGGSITFNGVGGGWALLDAFETTTDNSGTISLNNGSLQTNSHSVTGFVFNSASGNTRSLSLGSSVINLWAYTPAFWNVTAPGMTLDAGTSTIIGNGFFGGFSPTFNGGGLTYYNLIFANTSAQPGTVNGNNTFNDITFNSVDPGYTGTLNGNNTINNVLFKGNGSVTGNNTINNLTFTLTGNIGAGTNTFTSNVVFLQNGNITSNNTFNNLTFSPGYTYTLSAGRTQTINGLFSATGNCGGLIAINSATQGNQSSISIAAGTVNVAYVNLKDMAAIGGATFNAPNSIDLGNNTGWNITSPVSKNLYWITNAGNWSDGNHWALSSGGSPSGCAPTPVDNVFFDVNSFSAASQTVTVDVPTAYCRNMTWTGALFNPTFASDKALKIHGSITLISGMSLNHSGPVSFEAITTGQTITSAGKKFGGSITFNGVGGGWALLDAFETNTANSGTISLNNGSLQTNSHSVTGFVFNSASGNTRSLSLGSSVINLWAYTPAFWNVTAPGMTLDAGTSTIIGNGFFGGFSPTFNGGGLTYYNLIFANTSAQPGTVNGNNTFNDITFNSVDPGYTGTLNGNNTINNVLFKGNGSVTGNNTINNLTFTLTGNIGAGTNTFTSNVVFLQNGNITSNNTFNNLTFSPGYTYTLSAGRTQTINGLFSATGNCGGLIAINSATQGNQSSISIAAGTVNVAYVNLKDMAAIGGATFNAPNSIDLGNNTGWNITSPVSKNLYWITNAGNWSDGNHWALSSGGSPSGCAPTPVDNVFFDVNSFSAASQTVTVDVPTAYCRNMTWTGALFNPTFASDKALKIHGSITLISGMSLNHSGPVSFEAITTGQTITSAGKKFGGSITFNGVGGGWALLDAFETNTANSGTISLNNGSLQTNSHSVTGFVFNSASGNTRSLSLGSSVINLWAYTPAFWNVTAPGMTLDAGTSTIIGNGFFGGFSPTFNGGGLTYYNLIFANTSAQPGTVNGNNTFNDITFNSVDPGYTGTLNGNNTINNVLFKGNGSVTGNNTINNLTFTLTGNIGAGTNTFTSNVVFLQNGNITSNNTFNNLTFSPGYTYTLSAGRTQTIGNNLNISGTGSFPVRIQSATPGSASAFYKESGVICVDYIRISDNQASGGALFNTGTNSQDLGGNSGWNFNAGGGGSTPDVTISASPAGTTCQGTEVTFTASSTNSTSPEFNWYINGISIQTGASTTFSSSTLLDGDSITCVVSSSSTCGLVSATSDTIVVDVVTETNAGIISTTKDTICFGSGATLQLSGNSGSIQWQSSPDGISFTNINNATTDAYSVNPDQTTYFRVFTNNGSCSDTSAVFPLNVVIPPVASFSYEQAEGYLINFNNESNHGSSYFWDFGNGDSSTDENPEYLFPFDGIYPVRLITKNGCGSDTSILDVEVFKLVGLEEFSDVLVRIFPNPFQETFRIKISTSASEAWQIRIYNLTGAQLHAQQNSVNHSQMIEVNFSEYPSGIYLLGLSDPNGREYRIPLIKSN
jgi:hypothetical protein